MIESEFAEVDTPPIGDLVGNAIRDGQRLRRTRLVQRGVACAAAVGVLVLGLGMASATLRPEEAPNGFAADRRQSETVPAVPTQEAEPSGVRATGTVAPDAPTMAIFDSDAPLPGATAQVPPAQPEAVLLALQMVLPTGPTVALAGSRFDTYTGVQVFLDRGAGFGMIRVAVARFDAVPKCESPTPGIAVECTKDAGALIERFEIESNCVQRRGVTVYRPDGIAVQVNVGSCVAAGDWSTPGIESVDDRVLDMSEAIEIGKDPIWTQRSLDDLQRRAIETHPSIPMLTSFDGVGA
jgi:hypothetical protein